MFMGEYNHSIDPKGRIIVPARFREQLGGEFVVTQGLDGCLNCYQHDEFENVGKRFMELSKMDAGVRKLSRFFFSGAVVCEVDKQGRILIPANLRNYAGLTKDVVFAGNLDHVEIWDSARWADESRYDDVNEVAEHLANLGISI